MQSDIIRTNSKISIASLTMVSSVSSLSFDYWIVTIRHFGSDSPNEYTGKKLEVAWEDGQNALFRIYTKDLKTDATRIRRERQQYPNKRFDEAIDEKLPTLIKMRAVPNDV